MSQVVHLELYAPSARAAFVSAQKTADARRHVQVTPPHLLVALLEAGAGRAAIARGGGDPEAVLAAAKRRVDALPTTGDGESYLSTDLLALMSRAESEAARLGRPAVDFVCLFRAFDAGLFALDAAPWPEAERANAPAKAAAAPSKRVTFELALSRAARALAEVAPRVLAATGREHRRRFASSSRSIGS